MQKLPYKDIHLRIYIRQGNFNYYFGLDCIKRFARDQFELETENNFKRNKQMIFSPK